MTETKSIQEYVLKGTNFSISNVMDNKKIFEDRLETWLHKIDEAGGNLSDEDKETFGNQEQAIQFVEAEQVTNLEDIERELENVSGLVAPLNVLKDWSNNNLSVLEEQQNIFSRCIFPDRYVRYPKSNNSFFLYQLHYLTA